MIPSVSPQGRLAVLLPVLNCRPLLPRQVDAISGYLDLIDEILVVDSHSMDGTVDYLRENLRHPRLRVVSHPPGLYESWNAGLALLSSEYVHIATAGDRMSREGLEHLLGEAARFRADIVVSPPAFEVPPGEASPEEDWPIHHFVKTMAGGDAVLLSQAEALRWTFEWGARHCGVLGSSASNLYRAELLKTHPFPTDSGFCGDVAWGLRNIHRARVVVTPRRCAHFLHHAKPERPYAHIGRSLFGHACAGVVDFAPGLAGPVARLAGFPESILARNKASTALAGHFRGAPCGGAFSRAAWRLRLEKVRAQSSLLRMPIHSAAWPAHFRRYLEMFMASVDSTYFKCEKDRR